MYKLIAKVKPIKAPGMIVTDLKWNLSAVKSPNGHPKAFVKPNPDFVVIGRVKPGYDKNCPFCHQLLISVDFSKRRCMSCHMYLAQEHDTLADVVAARAKAGVYTMDIDTKHAPKDIYMWERTKFPSYYELIYKAPPQQ